MSETKQNTTPAATPFTGFTKDAVHAKIETIAERIGMRDPNAKTCSADQFARLLAGTAHALGLAEKEGTEFLIGMISLWDHFPKSASAMRGHLYDRKDAPKSEAPDVSDLLG